MSRKDVWTPERRKLQSRIISRRLKDHPWTAEQNEARARSLRGRVKTLEARAAMYATKVHGSQRGAEWQQAYALRLSQLRSAMSWDMLRDYAHSRNLQPHDVKYAIDQTFGKVGIPESD